MTEVRTVQYRGDVPFNELCKPMQDLTKREPSINLSRCKICGRTMTYQKFEIGQSDPVIIASTPYNGSSCQTAKYFQEMSDAVVKPATEE